RDSVASVAKSFFALFHLPVRVISHEGDLLADEHRDRPLCNYVNTLPVGRRQCAQTVEAVRDLEPSDEPLVHPCFTGAVYRVVPLAHQGRLVGRFVIGPYVPAETQTVPESLISLPSIDAKEGREHWTRMPRVRADIADLVCAHLKRILELLVFSGHRAQLASTMQMASVRESYRELAQKNEALKESYEELKQVDKLKSTFLATVSHELRSPLTSILGYTEMLQSGAAGALAEEQSDILKTIHAKAEELLGLISSLLDLGRLEAKTLNLQREAVDARALLSGVGSTIVPSANWRNIALDIEVEAATPKIWGDPVRLRQILLNLAENAIKFTGEGGTVSLRAELGRLDEAESESLGSALFTGRQPAVVLTVRDTGMGIAEDKLTKIFDVFYQVDAGTTRAHGGAGLGLSIVKQLVTAHGGTIEVDSVPSEGTSFTVKLPAAQHDA
ncbi:MAG: ATP-binding protein, partial [Myxococcales bacterium]